MDLFKSDPPPAKPTARMPDPEDPAVRAARARAASDVMARSGRESTVLTRPQNRPTYDTFAAKALG